MVIIERKKMMYIHDCIVEREDIAITVWEKNEEEKEEVER